MLCSSCFNVLFKERLELIWLRPREIIVKNLQLIVSWTCFIGSYVSKESWVQFDCYFVSRKHKTSRVPGADGRKAGGFDKQWNLNQDSSRGSKGEAHRQTRVEIRKYTQITCLWFSACGAVLLECRQLHRETVQCAARMVVEQAQANLEFLSLPTLRKLLGWDKRMSKMW